MAGVAIEIDDKEIRQLFRLEAWIIVSSSSLKYLNEQRAEELIWKRK